VPAGIDDPADRLILADKPPEIMTQAEESRRQVRFSRAARQAYYSVEKAAG